MFSRHAAFAAFEEHERGTVAAGMRGDLTVLSRDPTAIPAAEILAAKASLTIVGGRIVHGG